MTEQPEWVVLISTEEHLSFMLNGISKRGYQTRFVLPRGFELFSKPRFTVIAQRAKGLTAPELGEVRFSV